MKVRYAVEKKRSETSVPKVDLRGEPFRKTVPTAEQDIVNHVKTFDVVA